MRKPTRESNNRLAVTLTLIYIGLGYLAAFYMLIPEIIDFFFQQ